MIFKEKVLVLHRNKLVKEKIFNYLHENDFAVIMANNVEITYSLAKSMTPDIILWGETLTAGSKEMLRKIKSSRFGSNIPVIAMIPNVELFDRIDMERNGINDIIDATPNFTDLKLKIRFHLSNRRRMSKYEHKIHRLQEISELQYNIIRLTDTDRLCELVIDYISDTFHTEVLLAFVFNQMTKEYDYNSFINRDETQPDISEGVFDINIWRKYFYSNPKLDTGQLIDPFLLNFFSTLGLKQNNFFQFPLRASSKQIGLIILGLGARNKLSKEQISELDTLSGSLAFRILSVRGGVTPAKKTREETSEIQHFFQRLDEDEISDYLSQQLMNYMKADAAIYFNYNEGFRFLYPQYCYRKRIEGNLFADEKPPVLMLQDYPTFEHFIEEKKISARFNFMQEPAPDLQKMAVLAGEDYSSLLLFTVKIGNEIKGFFLIAVESNFKRFTQNEIQEAEQMIQRATSALMESRVVRQAQTTIKQLDRVFDLGKELTLENEIDDLLKKIANAIRRTLGWNIVIIDKKSLYSSKFENISTLGLKSKEIQTLRQTYPNSIYLSLKERSFKIGNSYFFDNKMAGSKMTEMELRRFKRSLGKEWNDDDWVMVPIMSRGQELGCISVNDPVERLRPTEGKVKSLEYFANQAAVALENASLYENLKSSELKYRLLAETMILGLVACDFQGRIIYMNKSLSDMLKYKSSESLIDHNIFDLCSPKTSNEFEKSIIPLLKSGKNNNNQIAEEGIEIELLANDNKYIPFKIYLTDYYQQASKAGFLGVLSDLRPQRRIERLKSDFNSMIVHDLRSPLNIIQGYIDIVRNQVVGHISDEQSDLLFIAKENVDKVLKLIENFMTASKMEAGKFDLDIETHSLNALIEAVYEHHLVLTKKKNIDLSIELDLNLSLMQFDKLRIEQVISNYISNAIKFTEENGNIEIQSKMVKEQNALTGEEVMAAHVSVKDSGVGIPSDEQDKVFNKYEQTEAGKDASLKGTGLGLAICKEIISLHKGKIWVESDPGKGSTFYFSLPISPLKI